MMKKIYNIILLFGLLLSIGSCTVDPIESGPLVPGEKKIELNGMLTKAGTIIDTGSPLEDGYTGTGEKNIKFYMSARRAGTTDDYFLNRPLSVEAHTTAGLNYIKSDLYYPLGDVEIDLFAHTTSQINASGNLVLESGTKLSNDYLFGIGSDDQGNEKSGKADAPLEFITFKHLMTKVTVKIEVDGSIEPTIPTSLELVALQNGPIVNRGTYSVEHGTITETPTAGYSFGEITTTAKSHYLVANGKNLTALSNATPATQIFSSLKIDEYEATEEDLKAIKIPKADNGGVLTDFVLNPGEHYELTFKINRLKLVGIELKMVDWTTHPGDVEWGYDPKSVTLDTGGEYVVTNADNMVTKIVLHYEHDDGGGNKTTYQYIGKGRLDGGVNKVDFVTLPASIPSGAGKVDLYTKDGLLAQGIAIEVVAGKWELQQFGLYGMTKGGTEDGKQVYEVYSAQQLMLMLNDATKGSGDNRIYRFMRGADMDNCAIEMVPTDFPANSIIDGQGHQLLHLNVNGNGLVVENHGVIKGLNLASGTMKGKKSAGDYIGAIAAKNFGTIEGCVNGVEVSPEAGQEFVGGIAGSNEATGVINACVNSGNLLSGETIGGIVGENNNNNGGAITACVSTGLLYGSGATNVGGIVGTSVKKADNSNHIVKVSYWLTGTARKDQANQIELAIGNITNHIDVSHEFSGADAVSGDLAASEIRGATIVNALTAAAGANWNFLFNATKSSWPYPVPNP